MLQAGNVGDIVRAQVAILSSDRQKASNGEYLRMVLSDGEAQIPAKWWQYSGPNPALDVVYHVIGSVAEYQGTRELHIKRMQIMTELSVEGYRPHSKHDIEELFSRAIRAIDSIEDELIKSTVRYVYIENRGRLEAAPAAKTLHHAYVGGLLEHKLEVLDLALSAGEGLNRDHIVAGSLLHDIGKLDGYEWVGASIVDTDVEQLIGHIAIGVGIWTDAVNAVGVGFEDWKCIAHIIASHHGPLEWGSTAVPKTAEAMMVHQADMMSSRKAMFLETVTGNQEDDPWTPRHFALGTKLYKGGR